MSGTRIVTAFAVFFFCANAAWSQLSLSTLGSPAPIINFTDTVAGVNNGAYLGTGFQSSPNVGQLDSDAWAVTGWSNGSLAFGGTQTTANTDYTRGSFGVAVTTGGMYNFSGPNANTLGIQPGGSDWAPGTITLRVQNNTGATLSQIDISYDVYIRNDESRSNSFNFSYSSDNSSYTNVSALDITSVGTLVSSAPFDPAINRTTSITGISVANGDFFYLRWSGADAGGSGSRDEFALDNISVTPVPEPATILGLSAAGFGLVGFARRLRRNA